MEISTLGSEEVYDRKKARELRPCLVVAVDYGQEKIQVARLCDRTPRDTRRWVRVDSTPSIIWRLPNAWIWIATPPTISMVFNNHKVMHPHKDLYYTSNPVAALNLQNYWVHRKNYITWHPAGTSGRRGTFDSASSSANMIASPHTEIAANSSLYPTDQTPHSTPGYLSQGSDAPPGRPYPYHSSPPGHGQPHMGFNTLSAQPVVLPPGFTETNPTSPGWWRNPETGWFWNASRGLLPPSVQR
ncbi:hypothetical protein B0H15DRAFT_166579 [Mycena belliarum]|uniref:Uncharacterized protein n=1 Tax=Mycena belliarum TaxID=1033014 RepID=A0AAD6XSY8_9AGAR|nr:hypothetical protein B0H15DRAFT_166579 [Mycena belliae]